MGLDIGVVNIEYLERPAQPIYGFLQALMADPNVGMSADDDMADSCWGDGWANNAFYEFYREGLVKQASGWAEARTLDQSDRTKLLDWIDNLPYRGDAVMLHLGN